MSLVTVTIMLLIEMIFGDNYEHTYISILIYRNTNSSYSIFVLFFVLFNLISKQIFIAVEITVLGTEMKKIFRTEI
jgi:hypothetical protein